MTERSRQLLLRFSFCWLLLALPGAAVSQDQSTVWNLELSIDSGQGDAEEFLEGSLDDSQRWPPGYTYTVSSDLELGNDPQHGPQLVGLRFEGVDIPAGARIEEAVLEFSADSAEESGLEVTISAEASVDPLPFEQDPDGVGSEGLSSRVTGSAAVAWSPGPWTAGESYRSPDIAALLQELVHREDWKGDALVLLIAPATTGSGGFRSAVSNDETPNSAPRLLVRFAPPAAGDPVGATLPVPEPRPPGVRSLTPQTGMAKGNAEKGDRERSAGERQRPETADQPPEAAGVVEEREAPTDPDEPRRVRFALHSNHARGVSGNVLLSDYGLGGTAITLFVEGVAAGVDYSVSIHPGDCGKSSAPVLELEPVSGSRPFSTTIVPRELDELIAGELHLNVYRNTEEFIRVAGCARLGN